MAVTAGWFGVPIKNIFNGANPIDWDTDTIKIALCSSALTVDVDTQDFFNDVSANEIAGTGYTAGGITLTSPTVTYDTASNEIRLDAADVTWTTATFTARYAIVYKSTGTGSTSPLICYINFGADQSPSAANFTIQFDATGVAKITV